MKISLSIMCVPRRAVHVAKMLAALNPQIAAARAAGLDVAAEVPLSCDTAHRGPWYAWRGAWETHRGTGATHHVVLQDDVIFCADLPATLHRLAAARPDAMISGFLPRGSVDKAVAGGLRWVRARRFLWAQCVMLPTALGDAALQWIDAHEGTPTGADWNRDDDVRLGAFLAAHKLPVFVPVPHPVEHIGDELGSVMGHHGPAAKRRARAWLGEAGAGGALPWDDLRAVNE